MVKPCYTSCVTGTIVAGPPGSGKSSCIETLVEALSLSPREKSGKSRVSRHSTVPLESNHKLQRINPVVVDDDSLMFGYINQNQDFVDGIFTTTFKKANRVRFIFSKRLHERCWQSVADYTLHTRKLNWAWTESFNYLFCLHMIFLMVFLWELIHSAKTFYQSCVI